MILNDLLLCLSEESDGDWHIDGAGDEFLELARLYIELRRAAAVEVEQILRLHLPRARRENFLQFRPKEAADEIIGDGDHQSLFLVDADERAAVGAQRHAGNGLRSAAQQEQRPRLHRLVRLLGKKIVAVRNEWTLVLDAEDAGVERTSGYPRIDRLSARLEKSQGLAVGVEVIGVDGRHGTAALHDRHRVCRLELILRAAQKARRDPLGIEAQEFQVERISG